MMFGDGPEPCSVVSRGHGRTAALYLDERELQGIAALRPLDRRAVILF